MRGSRDGFCRNACVQYGSDPAAHPRSEAADGNHEYWGKFAHRYRHLLHGKPGGHRTFKPHPHPDSKSACRCPLDEPGKALPNVFIRTNGSIRSQNFVFSERPDTSAASILEGNIIILVDNSPSAMILPSSVFDIIEEADDYYFSTADRHLSAPVADGHLFPDLISDTAVAAFYAESRLDPGMARFYPCHRRDPCGADLSASDPGICHRWSAARGSQHPQHADDTAQCHRRYRAWRILGQIRLVQQRDDALYGVRHDRQLLDDELRTRATHSNSCASCS